MEQSILTGTKKILGLDAAYNAFDFDIITHINAAFSTLEQLGLGPAFGFMIEDDTAEWTDFTEDVRQLGQVKTYVFLKVKMLFDPPQTGYLVDAATKQIEELEWRINVRREGIEWVDPTVVQGE